MAWVSELEGSEFQTMFISHIYATERVRAGNEMLVNYASVSNSHCQRVEHPDQSVEKPDRDW